MEKEEKGVAEEKEATKEVEKGLGQRNTGSPTEEAALVAAEAEEAAAEAREVAEAARVAAVQLKSTSQARLEAYKN